MYNRNPTSWTQRWSLERGLTVLIVSGIFLCITEVVGTAEVLGGHPPAEQVQNVSRQAGNEDVCLTPQCNHIASIITKNMDPSVDPCDDFYRFACGGFLNSTIEPSDEESVIALGNMAEMVKEQLRASIEEPSEPNEPKSFRLAKNLYKSCMNTIALDEQGLEPLLKIIKKLGGWPVLYGDLWNETDFDWINSTYKLHDAGYAADYFLSFRMNVDWTNRTRNVLTLDTANLGLYNEYLIEGLDNEVVEAYYTYMVDIAGYLGAEMERANTELKKSLLFEIELAKIILKIEETAPEGSLYHLMSLDKLTNTFPSIPWREYFSKLLPKNIIVEENEMTIVNAPSFISELEELLSKTPKRVQANYMIWRAVQASITYLNIDVRWRQLVYSIVLTGDVTSKPRWEECVDNIFERFPVALSAMYVKKYTSLKSNQYVAKMVMDIKHEFYNMFKQVEWMDDDLRELSIESIEQLSGYVAYPDELMNKTNLEKLYENLELSGGHYLDSMLNLSLFNEESLFRKLREPTNELTWVNHENPAVIRLMYESRTHSIDIPAAVLQDPLFGIARPSYMNYGMIGSIVSILIAHAFRSLDHGFGVDGNLNNRTPEEENYLKRIECIIHQYGNYTVEEIGLKLNGTQTEDHNVADNAGMKAAYLAYKSWAKRNAPELKLPGLPYSPNQLFWIGATVPWCTKHRFESLTRSIKKDRFSPPEFRILGTMSNMPQFSEDFKCPIGSKMNPEKKCSVL